MLFLFALSLTVLLGVHGQEECDDDDYSQCGEDELVKAMSNFRSALPSEEFLLANCRNLQENIPCHIELMNKCHPGFQMLTARHNGSLAVINAICDKDSSLGASYLRNVECYNTVLDSFRHCYSRHLISHYEVKRANMTRTPGELMVTHDIRHCTLINMDINCFVKKTSNTCGTEAASTLRLLLDMFAEPIKIAGSCNKENVRIYTDMLLTYYANNIDEAQLIMGDFSIDYIA